MKLAAGVAVTNLVQLAYESDKAVLLEGPHGCGKSSLFEEAASLLGIEIIVRDLSLMEPPDLVGIPEVANDVTRYAPPSFLPREGRGIIVFEELNRCPRYMRSSCLELLTLRRLNDYVLPSGWVPMAAINPAADGYLDAEELDVALVSRFLHVQVEPDTEQWAGWARANGVHGDIVSFVEQSPGVFESGASNPRSWTYASDVLHAWETNGFKDDHELLAAALAGTLGDNWALAFLRFFQNAAKPLTASEIVNEYPSHRAMLNRWVSETQLDLVAATLNSTKKYLQRQRNYEKVVGNAREKANVEQFLGDLPAELKRQVDKWLEDRGFTNLSVPHRVVTV